MCKFNYNNIIAHQGMFHGVNNLILRINYGRLNINILLILFHSILISKRLIGASKATGNIFNLLN